MAKIALNNANINQAVAPNHINYRKWEYSGSNNPTYPIAWDTNGNPIAWGGGDPIYRWNSYQTFANINGTVKATVTNVKIQGSAPIVVGDSTTESDSYTIPSGGEYVSGSHAGATGKVTVGNSRNVFANGKSIAIGGSALNTHAGVPSTIKDGLSTTVNIG